MASIRDPLEHQYAAQREALREFHREHPVASGTDGDHNSERGAHTYAFTDPFSWLAEKPGHLSVSYSASKVLWSIYRREMDRYNLDGQPPNFRDQEVLDIEDTALTSEQAIAVANDQYNKLDQLSRVRRLTPEEFEAARRYRCVIDDSKIIRDYREFVADKINQLRPPSTTQEVRDTAKLATAIIGLSLR